MNSPNKDYFQNISNFGKMFLEAYDMGEVIQTKRKNVIICGMGGSGITGNYLESLSTLNKSKNQAIVWRSYDIPLFLNSEWLAIVISYSGNTEETLSMIAQLQIKEIETYVISSGGKLEKFAIKNDLFFSKIPTGYPPRFALPIILGRVYRLTENMLNLKTISDGMRLDINSFDNLKETDILEQISLSILNNVPIILSDDLYAPLSLRFRCQLNENSKKMAHNYVLPEFSHNAVVGFENLDHSNYCLVIINSGKSEHQRIKLHREFIEDYAKRKKIIVYTIESRYNNTIIKLLDITRQLDYISYNIALLSKVNPISVESIDELKLNLNKK